MVFFCERSAKERKLQEQEQEMIRSALFPGEIFGNRNYTLSMCATKLSKLARKKNVVTLEWAAE